MRILISTIFLLAGILAHAAPSDRVYKCELVVIAEGVPNGALSQSFERPDSAPGGHGGEYLPFEFGSHIVLVQADGKWRSIYWVNGETVIAHVVTATSQPVAGDQALIVVNPKDEQEQVSLSCSIKE